MQHHWQLINRGTATASDTPRELWEKAYDYFDWCEKNPIIVKRTLTSGKEAGRVVNQERTRPYTIEGLCLHCGIDYEYIMSLKNMKGSDSLWAQVINRIMMVIKAQNIEYAVTGEFNPVFTAKILNIDTPEDTPSPIRIEHVQGLPDLSENEDEILKKLDEENGSAETAA